ncbi:hypothetical protein AMATHDRAFT_7250 [Amanita thiersii Skay4041]|uniref:non-specific serine/threonine protein kinase n=1 Tax=Amanita thiersii Skay4041 TaxID=703135 RepID=A0A2A9NGT9_9AGAR|nr:hypothetical protein AMATHDRAFT_7250 [Amanita thiersii Skay4041]
MASKDDELQQLEITALKSIYDGDFIESPPPKAWKGAARLPEFIIRVPHPDPTHSHKVSLSLNVKFPKTYPTRGAVPIFTIEKPIQGITQEQVTLLAHAISVEVQKHKGFEMVFQIVDFTKDWIAGNIKPPVEVVGSLALQMTQRAMELERARKQREAEAASLELERQNRLAEQIKTDAMRQLLARGDEYHMSQQRRQRANSEATEVPSPSSAGADTPTETFAGVVEVAGVRFDTVKVFQPRIEGLGTVYLAEPLSDEIHPVVPLELLVVTFDTHYYTTSQGRKKLKQVETEIQRLTSIRHPNLLSVFAVKLYLPHSSGAPRLVVLSEQAPPLTLYDVLQDCESVKEERASDYLGQILAALNAVHAGDLVHRGDPSLLFSPTRSYIDTRDLGINARCIGLVPREHQQQPQPHSTQSKQIKLGRVCYYTRLLDLHRSNEFGSAATLAVGGGGGGGASGSGSGGWGAEEGQVPDAWLSRDVQNESSLIYTRKRDIHAVGIVLLQMLLGLDVTSRYTDVHDALRYATISSTTLSRQVLMMLDPPKKNHITCLTLLADLAEASRHTSTKTVPIAILDPVKTPRPLQSSSYGTPPDSEFSRMSRPRHASRWKEDWEELELLGKGAFGSVVKARNKIDGRIYAVKKIRLRTVQKDTKIFREVNALSRLSHRFIVRYYTTWVETSEAPASVISDTESGSEIDDADGDGIDTDDDGLTSVPSVPGTASERHLPRNGGFSIDLSALDELSKSHSRGSFPSIHFSHSKSPGTSGESSSGDEEGGSGGSSSTSPEANGRRPRLKDIFVPGDPTFGGFSTPPSVLRTLYIQMEFVERQTLKERLDEGISEDDAWRLLQQILDALVHMSTLGILHRDIKLTNIFIDAKGDCKVGDFGLATSSLAAVDPSDVSPHVVTPDADMTLEVGTRLYIAPEVQSWHRGPRNHSKADMYSLGIVFFEMNYKFTTGAERIAVIEDLRKPGIFFPPTWDPQRTRQREIITWLLQHEPDDRPTALELSQSSLLPPRVEDEYFKGALEMIAKPDSPHLQTVLSSLFSQPPKPTRGFLYDYEADVPEHATLNDIVIERLSAIFRLHGAIDMEPPLLMPVSDPEDIKNHATFIDRHGDVVMLPNSVLVPFARLAARASTKRIKRFHIADVYRPNPLAGHPKVSKAAAFDIITQDLKWGPIAAGAEIISVVDECLNSFPNLGTNYEIRISHAHIVELVLGRLPAGQRNAVVEILNQPKSSSSQKRALLLKKGLLRSTADELEILSDADDEIDNLVSRLEKISPTFADLIKSHVEEIKRTTQYAVSTGVTRPIYFHPLMLGSNTMLFRDGVIVVVVRKNKPSDVLAVGGRYDSLIAKYSPLKTKADSTCAVGIQIAMDKITSTIASYQSTSLRTLVKETRSFGFWSPRRCDVYVVSYHPGYLQERLEVVTYLWQHNISADIMYESGLPDAENENIADVCAREGILFTVYPRPRTGRREQSAFKVKSILKGTEYELSKQELVGWLQHQIAEQKRVDVSTSGAPMLSDATSSSLPVKEMLPPSSDVQLLLPLDTKKQRKHVKQLFLDRAFETGVQLKTSIQNGLPILAVDVNPTVFDAMTRSQSGWITDEEAWKTVVNSFPSTLTAYAQQIREAAAKRRAEGHRWMILFAVREERVQLLNLQ